jgi:GT2 family glycosyltransferase
MSATNGKPRGLASVIVPCFSQLEFTRHCLTALFRHTRAPWELIVVDNGSTDGTAMYLAGVQDASPVPITVVSNPANRGYASAVNHGLTAALGDFLVLLDNDAVVTDGWLDQLVALAGADPTIGLTGPMSNAAMVPQLVEHVPYADLERMPAFASNWRDQHRGQWFTVGRLSGFCLLMKRAVYDKVRGLDESFVVGFADDDLAERARRAGFQLAVAHDLFVHHFGGRTMAASGIDVESQLGKDHARFAAKWGLPEPEVLRVLVPPWSSPAEATPNASRRARIRLTMIVRNEEQNLTACLGSAKGLFDEMVVVDTGSADRTQEIAREFGAKVFEFGWIDNFAAARNAALSHATGDYAFWLDADDVLDVHQRDNLRRLLDGLRPGDEAAYVVRCACDPEPRGGGQTVVDHIRLFPLRPDVRWTYRVHEQILPALRRAKVPVRWSNVTVRHTGYTDPALRARKLVRDEAILRTELAERPDDPFVLFNLGSIAIERQEWRPAIPLLRKSLAGSATSDSITRKLFALIARCHQMLGDSAAALQTCAQGLVLDPDDAELLFRLAVVHRQRGESADAETCWRRILTVRRPEEFCSVDQGIYGHLTRRNLAALAAERGDHAEAGRLWLAVLAECPGDREALAKLERPSPVHA